MKKLLTIFTISLLLTNSFQAFSTDYFVTNLLDGGPGSLRQCIYDANSSSGPNSIFVSSSLNGTINLSSALPTITTTTYIYLPSSSSSNKVYINGNNLQGPVFKYSNTNMFTMMPGYAFAINFTTASYIVTNTNLSGLGSLPDIVLYCEQTSVKDLIAFNIPGTAPHTINSYPVHTYPIYIDGASQPANGYTGNMPKIELQKSGIWNLNGTASEVYGIYLSNAYLQLNSSSTNATIGISTAKNVFSKSLLLNNSTNVTITNNYIGTDPNASTGNTGGITLTSTKNCTISKNVICPNGGFAIGLYGDTNTVINGNKIGTNLNETTIINSRLWGIYTEGTVNLTIGGSNSTDKNTIVGFTTAGIQIGGYSYTIKGNHIGVYNNATQVSAGSFGIRIYDTQKPSSIGGPGTYEGNVVSGNNYNIELQNSKHVNIYRNKLGSTDDGVTPIGNSSIHINCINSCDSIIIGDVVSSFFSNYLIGASIAGVSVDNSDHITIRGNKFQNNGTGIAHQVYNSNPPANIWAPAILELLTTRVSGTSLPNATIDLYYNASNSNVESQGKIYFATVTANASGQWAYNGNITLPCQVTCTSTDITGVTSMFAQGIGAVADHNLQTCVGNTITLTASGGTQYTWSPSTGLDDPTIATPTLTGANSENFTVAIYNATYGCSGVQKINVEVLPNNVTADAGSDATICNGDLTTIGTTAISGYTYSWSPSTDLSDPTAAITDAQPANTTTYTVTASDGQCSKTSQVTVNVNTCTNLLTDNTASSGISPNPASTTFSLYGFTNSAYEISIVNLNGEELLTQTTDESSEVNVSSLSPGVYLYLIKDLSGQSISKGKLIKY